MYQPGLFRKMPGSSLDRSKACANCVTVLLRRCAHLLNKSIKPIRYLYFLGWNKLSDQYDVWGLMLSFTQICRNFGGNAEKVVDLTEIVVCMPGWSSLVDDKFWLSLAKSIPGWKWQLMLQLRPSRNLRECRILAQTV